MIMMEPPFNALIKQIFTDPKDQNRLFSALKDGTLKFPNSVSSTTKKVALLKVSKQNYVGMIVGKKGSNIMQMRNQTNTDVQNPQQGDEPFRVYGESYKDLAKMALWILQQDDRLSGIESGKEPNDGSFKMEARIWCCSRYVGLLVGPNGGTIRQIKEDSGCCIQSPPRNEKMKYFTLTGSWDEITCAYMKMEMLINKKYNSGHYNSCKTCDCANNVCEKLKLCHPEGGLPSVPQTHMNNQMNNHMNMPLNSMQHLSPPPSYHRFPLPTPYSPNTTDQLAREQYRDSDNFQLSPTNTGVAQFRETYNLAVDRHHRESSQTRAPAIAGSRVFSGSNDSSPNSDKPLSAVSVTSNSSSYDSPPNQLPANLNRSSYDASLNRDQREFSNLQSSQNCNYEELIQILLAFNDLQVNREGNLKPGVNDVLSSPRRTQSMQNGFIDPRNNVRRYADPVDQYLADYFPDMSWFPRNPGMNRGVVSPRLPQSFYNNATF